MLIIVVAANLQIPYESCVIMTSAKFGINLMAGDWIWMNRKAFLASKFGKLSADMVYKVGQNCFQAFLWL